MTAFFKPLATGLLCSMIAVSAFADLKDEMQAVAQTMKERGDKFAEWAVAISQPLEAKNQEYLFLEEPLNKLMDAIVRKEGRIPSILGETGSGKTALLREFSELLGNVGKLPSEMHRKALADTRLLTVSGRNFMAGGIDLKVYLTEIQTILSQLQLNPVIVITDTQFLTKRDVSILTEFAQTNTDAVVVLEQSDTEFSNTKAAVANFSRYVVPIRVPQYTDAQVLEMLERSNFVTDLEKASGVRITQEALEAAISISGDYRVDLANPTRTFQLLDDAVTAHARQNARAAFGKAEIYKYVAQRSGVKVVPQDRERFLSYIEELRAKVKARVLGQDHIVDGLIDQFKAALVSQSRKHSLAMIMGPTGVGKTYGAEVLAEEFYGSKERVLELDMTQFAEKSQVNVLLGAPNGYLSSDTNKGVLCEFLDGRGQGGGVIIMNEFEEAHADAITRLMELFDKGYVRCGDGKLRYLGRSLIVMTSNKNSESILPASRIQNVTVDELEKLVAGITQEQMKKAWTEKSSYTQSDDSQVKTAVVERIDKYYYAKPLLPNVAADVMKLEVNKFVKEQKNVEDVDLEVSDEFSDNLLNAFYNQENGARQVRTMVQQTLSKALTEFRKLHGYEAKEFVITAELKAGRKTDSIISITDKQSGKSISFDGPRVPVANKLFDPEVRTRLQNLEAQLKAEVFGQDEAIASVVGAAKSRFLKPDSKKSIAGFLIGTTGTGKTQLAKSLSKALYGRKDAMALFEMGRVSDEHDLNDILSPPKGIIGSDKPGQLESFLQAFPDGGVLLFDEMSNVGGNNLALKNAVFKQFYGMLEEGVYKSPSGKTYDLSKYIILFTGNEGEEIFKGLSSDTMINETYADATKNPESVKEVLRKAGVPDAFIGRLAFVTLMRPATSAVRQLIAQKMLQEWSQEIERSQPLDIQYSKEMVKDVADLMFSPQSGARSILQFLDVTLSQVVANASLGLDWEDLAKSGDRATLQLSIEAQKPTQPFYAGNEPDRKKAVIKVTASLKGQLVANEEIDFTEKANFMPQVHIGDAKATAAHEMGHLIASFTQTTGRKPVMINIIPEKIGEMSTLGYVNYRRVSVPGGSTYTRDRLVKEVAGLLAGSEAETLIAGSDRNVGRSNDVQKAGTMVRKIVLESHMIPELDGAEAYNNGEGDLLASLPDAKKKLFENYVNAIMEEGRALAVQTIRENAHVIAAGVALLMKHGRMNEKEIERLMERGEKVKTEAGWLKQKLVSYSFGYISADKIYPMSTDGIVVTDSKKSPSCDELLQAG